jgi:hypothetical protein
MQAAVSFSISACLGLMPILPYRKDISIMSARYRPDYDHDDLALAQKQLTQSRSRLTKFRALQNSLSAGSAERMQANRLVEEIEVLHRLIDQLCCQLRARTH